MGGTGKKVAKATAKAVSKGRGGGIDWDGLGKLLVFDDARKEFINLRRIFNKVNQTLQTKFNQKYCDDGGTM